MTFGALTQPAKMQVQVITPANRVHVFCVFIRTKVYHTRESNQVLLAPRIWR
jgi:hypothetical protein